MATRADSNLWTGIGNVPAEVQGWFDQALLDYLPADFIYMGWGERRDIPGNSGRTINLERPNLLTASTTAVDEYVTPVGQQFSTTSVSATVAWYGTHVPFSDRAVQVGLIRNLLGKIKDVLAVHKKDTMDQIMRDAMCAGTSVLYSTETANPNVIDSTDLTAGRAAVDEPFQIEYLTYAVAQLQGANVRKISKRIEPSTGVGTKGINPAYVMIAHYDNFAVIKAEAGTDWQDVADYPSHQSLLMNEVGTIRSVGGANVRVLMTTNAKKYTAAEAGGAEIVYCAVVFGEGAFIETAINGRSNGVIVQPLGSSGSADPMKQRGSIAWHDPFVGFVCDNNRVWRIEYTLA